MVRRYGGLAFGLGVLVVLAGAVFLRTWDGRSSAFDDAARRENVPRYVEQPRSDVSGAIAVVGDQPATELRLTVAVEPPPGSAEMQLADNPEFHGASWVPAAGSAEVPVSGAGFQTVFARFRLDDGAISQTSVAGGTVDPTYRAAVSSQLGPHVPSWVRPFSPTELVVRIEAGRLEHGSLEAYDLATPAPGDAVGERGGRKFVEREGEVYGLQVSARTDVIRHPDRLIGRALDVDRVIGDQWSITSNDDPAYGQAQAPEQLRHLVRPAGRGIGGNGDPIWETVHDIVVTLPAPLEVGSTYRIEAPTVEPIELRYDPPSMLSPAVRVNQVGFAPADEPKVAYLSGWFDGIGLSALSSPGAPGFSVVDVADGQVVLEGTGRPRPGGDELGKGDLTGSPVVELDFSSLDQPGRYRVCVEGVGCSYDFEIATGVWHELTAAVSRAMYHQRSGMELGPPQTPIFRPRPYHPDDGVLVQASSYSLLQAQTETGNTDFGKLSELGTAEVVDGAWGGHFDAGDWDRRIQHLWFARVAAQLVSEYPELFAVQDLNIAESGDGVPDLLDEALWSLELYERMQTPEGSVRGGIEASEHPPPNAASWVDDLAVYAYSPDIYSSYLYAGVAAEFSVALRPYDPGRADRLLESAQRAMTWAEEQDDGGVQAIADQRNVAAAAFLLATGDELWHDRFVETATFLDQGETDLSCHSHTRCDAAWLYLKADPSDTDESIRNELRSRFTASADALLAATDSVAYGWTVESPFVPLIWGLGSGGAPHASGLLKAYQLTGDEAYRRAALRSAGVALGANPLNRSLLTGFGHEPVRNPQINDVKNGGLAVWPGTPVYGHHLLNATADDQWVVDDILGPAGVSPTPDELPYLWQWYDVGIIALYSEFTVHQSHAEALLTFGTLAATAE